MSDNEAKESKTSDEILSELFNSFISKQPSSRLEDGEASSASSPSESGKTPSKKTKKSKKEKKKKKSKDRKKSPKRKDRPLSPLRDHRDHHRESRKRGVPSLDEWDSYPASKRSDNDHYQGYSRESRREHDRGRGKDYEHERGHRDYERSDRGHHRHYESRDRRHHHHREEQRPPKRSSSGHEDNFWENRWEAMEIQKKAEHMEKRGRHYLENDKRRDPKPSTSSVSKKRRSRSPSSETEELKRLKKMKEIQDLVVKESEKYVAEPLDPSLFEWDDKVKMWKRKDPNAKPGEKSYEEQLKERMEEQFREGKRLPDDKKDENNEEKGEKEPVKNDEIKEPQPYKKVDTSAMSLDEIEEIRKKREKYMESQKRTQEKAKKSEDNDDEKAKKSEGKDKEKTKKSENKDEEKEEGEVHSDDDEKPKNKKQPSTRSYRKRSRSKSKSRSVRRSRSKSRSRRKSRDRKRSRSRDRHDDRKRSRSRDRHDRFFPNFRSSRDGRGYRDREKDRDYYYRSRRKSRSRSPAEKRGGFRGSNREIDKAKLLAIAKRNAVKLLSSDNLMGMDHDRLIAIKSGGQNLRQLTDFCRELASKGITDEFDEDDDLLYGNSEDFHHPFEVKDRPIPNPFLSSGVSGERLTPAMKTAAMSHRMIEFPVSSGNAHRVKEADVDPIAELIEAKDVKAIEDKSETPLPAEPEPSEAEQFNSSNPLSVIMFGGMPEPPKALELEPVKEPEPTAVKEKVFDPIDEPLKDISSIVSQRLNAMKKLSENPNDPEALKDLYEAQKEMSKWATSKNKPGQFTGHTGAKILSHAELSMGIQAWARQDQFSKAQKVSGGFGEFMLKKMGWSEGEGLGKTRSGEVDPLTLDIKMDKKGLMAAEEDVRKRSKVGVITLTTCKDLSHKHPVSALMELASKRKWGPPNFTQIFECGPPHKKQYIFKVTVNGSDYQPTVASDNKKKAKSDAATVALQDMGLLEKDPNNPL